MKIQTNFAALKRTKWSEYLVRFLFGGSVTALAGIIANHFGPSIGGLFLAVPAIFPAAATLLEKHEEKKARTEAQKEMFARQLAGVDAAGAAMGSIGLIAFAIVLWQLLTRYPLSIVLIVALAAWFVISIVVWFARKTLWRSLRIRCRRRASHPIGRNELSEPRR